MRAFCLIKRQPFYRHDAFMAGLKAAGFQVSDRSPGAVTAGDVLVIWNRYGEMESLADRFEAQGGTVIVAENGYLNPGGSNPKFDAHEGKPGYYALALDGHNGSGRWPVGGPERWEALGIDLKPWRTGGEHILICPNRPFGSRKMMPPPQWAENLAKRLHEETGREVRIRQHPGNTRPAHSLMQDLRGCWGMAIWASTAGLHALIHGVAVSCHAPYWICKDALAGGMDLRRQAFERLAWAQWHVNEIASGEPFERLMECISTKPATETT